MSSNLAPGWSYKKLGQLGHVERGRSRHRPRNDPSLYGGPYPFFQTGDVKAAELYLSHYSQTYNEAGLAQSKLWQPGTLCITIAANIAESAILKIKGCFPDSIVGFVADPAEADVRFVKYVIDTMKLQMQSISRGTTQDNLSLEKLLAFDFLTPPFPTQRKIAAILSAYDDLIENNTRRIAILEEMAQAIYREWFINFRFPGHEKVAMVDSELGPIPEGWEVRRLDDVCISIKDGDWIETKDQGGSDYRLLQVSNIGMNEFVETGKYRYITQEAFDRLRCTEIQVGDILVSRMPEPIGRAWLVAEMPWRMITAVDVAILKADPNTVDSHYLTYSLNAPEQLTLAKNYATGTTRPRISRRNLSSLHVRVPLQGIQRRFHDFASVIYDLSDSLRRSNMCLRHARDLLMPRLISGKMDISELIIRIGERDTA